MPYYDQWGWYSAAEIAGRYTDTPIPDNIPDGSAANWTGHVWRVMPYSAPPGVPAPTTMTKLAFRNRFTLAEKIAIEIAGVDKPTGNPSERANSAALRVYQQDVLAAKYIDPGRADTRAGVQQLEAAGLLAAGRAAEILDAPIAEHERYTD